MFTGSKGNTTNTCTYGRYIGLTLNIYPGFKTYNFVIDLKVYKIGRLTRSGNTKDNVFGLVDLFGYTFRSLYTFNGGGLYTMDLGGVTPFGTRHFKRNGSGLVALYNTRTYGTSTNITQYKLGSYYTKFGLTLYFHIKGRYIYGSIFGETYKIRMFGLYGGVYIRTLYLYRVIWFGGQYFSSRLNCVVVCDRSCLLLSCLTTLVY